MMAEDHYKNGWNLIINLASQPRRNRRLYSLMIFGLTILLVAVMAGLVLFNLSSISGFKKLNQSNQVLKDKKESLTLESRQLSREVDSLRQQYQEPVDEINSILERKAFSWVIFFNRLEEALPARSYIMALTPPASSSSREFRMKVALASRGELGGLVKNMQTQGFEEIRVLNESSQGSEFQVEMVVKDATVD
jgi:Tfp pilus assembly protein PilN